MAGEVLLVTQFLAAGLMLLLAGWLLYLNFHSRVVRAFSLFLCVRAASILSNQFGRVLPEDAEFWAGMRGYYELAVVPALAYFLIVFSGRWSDGRVRIVGWALVGLLFAIEGLYALDHCVSLCGMAPPYEVGPLGFLTFGFPLAFAVAALLLARFARQTEQRQRNRAAFLASVAFLVNALFESSLVLLSALATGYGEYLETTYVDNAWRLVPFWTYAATWPVALGTIVIYWRGSARTLGSWLAVGACALAVGSAWVMALVEPSKELHFTYRQLVIGTWRILLAGLVSVAITRYHLFGIDVKVKRGIARSVVAGTILAAFFVVSKLVEKGAEAFFEGQFDKETAGVIAGSIGAGLLLFAISPLQRVAERIGQAAVPLTGARNSRNTSERLLFYQDQAEIAWSDGLLGRRERLLLDQLRDRLGITPEEAASIEHDIAVQPTLTRPKSAARRKAHSPTPR